MNSESSRPVEEHPTENAVSGDPVEFAHLTDADLLHGYLEMWKKTVTVQQHFNDIEWRIRSVGLTAVAAVLGTASLTSTNAGRLTLGGATVNRSAAIVSIGLVLWLAFFFVDAAWYHKYLKASVTHAEALEQQIRKYLPGAGLTLAISAASPTKRWRLPEMHSTQKLEWFYGVIGFVLLILIVALQFGTT